MTGNIHRRLLTLAGPIWWPVGLTLGGALAMSATLMTQAFMVGVILVRLNEGRPFEEVTGLLVAVATLVVVRAVLAWLREVCVQLTAAAVVFGRGRSYVGCLGRHARELYAAQLRFGHRAGLEAGVAEVAVALGTVAVLALGAVLLVDGQIPFAAYPPAIVLGFYAFVPLTEVSIPLRMLGQIRASAIWVRAIAEAPPNVVNTGRAEVLSAAPLEVRFDDVSFSYRPADPTRCGRLASRSRPG